MHAAGDVHVDGRHLDGAYPTMPSVSCQLFSSNINSGLASSCVARYLEVVGEVPLTENRKVQKFVVRHRGVSAATWDREVAGVTVERP